MELYWVLAWGPGGGARVKGAQWSGDAQQAAGVPQQCPQGTLQLSPGERRQLALHVTSHVAPSSLKRKTQQSCPKPALA